MLRTRQLPLAIAIGIGMVVVTFIAVLNLTGGETAAATGEAATRPDTIGGLAELLFGSYLLPFEAASVLLLAAAVAVMVLAKREGRATKDQEGSR